MARVCPAISHLLFADDTMFFTRTNASCCEALGRILTCYEATSGQSINLMKSAITFSSKTPAEVRLHVRRTLNIQNEGGIGKYLGLPEHFGRKKKDIFMSLVDCIRQRAISWTTGFLYGTGKLILLKTVLTALPTYTMSCFKLPISLCKQIQSILTHFWWDLTPEARKICWVALKRLTVPKSVGGLGFREIEHFNDAMLAKLAWRLVKDPHSLLAQILLGKYCTHSTFLDSVVPKSSSHGWRGVIAGLQVLKKGLEWSVGDGRNINVWSEPWLSMTSALTPTGPPTELNSSLKVMDLLDPVAKEWNLAAVTLHLPQYEELICRLTLKFLLYG